MEDLIREIRDEFMDEAQDLLEEYQGVLNSIDKSVDENSFNAIYRIVHTLKGNSKACDFPAFSHTIHEFESFLDKFKNLSKIDTKSFVDKNFSFLSELFKVVDSLKESYDQDYDYSIFSKILQDDAKKKFKFLILDDEPSMVKLLKLVIQDKYEDAEVDTFTVSKEALNALEEKKYDIIFSDFNMPELNGIEVLSQTRLDTINNNTPFIMITGYKPPITERPEIYENVYFLEKPFEEKRVHYYVHCSLKAVTQVAS